MFTTSAEPMNGCPEAFTPQTWAGSCTETRALWRRSIFKPSQLKSNCEGRPTLWKLTGVRQAGYWSYDSQWREYKELNPAASKNLTRGGRHSFHKGQEWNLSKVL